MMSVENALPGGSDRACDIAKAATAELDGQGRVVAWTRAAERLLGYPARDILHHPATELLALPGDEVRAASVARWCRSGDGWGARSRRATGTAGRCSWRCRSRPFSTARARSGGPSSPWRSGGCRAAG